MPRGSFWTVVQVRRAADALRTGASPAEVAQDVGRSWTAVRLALARSKFSVQDLLTEGQRIRVQRILLAGGYTAEVAAAEGVTRRHAQHLITLASGQEDRRALARTATDEQARRIYLSVREVGYTETARRVGRPLMTVWKIANRYRDEVLPESPPLRGVRGRRSDLKRPAATSGAGG